MFFREKEARREQTRLRAQAEQAEQRETDLRRQAEANSAINQAAIYVSQGKIAEAHELLSELKILPRQPSLDGVSAFRSVGEWLARQQRWREAADYFYPLLVIDKMDEWQVVTLDYQACSVVLAEANDRERYDKFCQAAIATYGTTTNGDTAGRILKSCRLFPPDANLMAQLQPMAGAADQMFRPMPAENFPGWATIYLSLWHYRHGDDAQAEMWCRRADGKAKGSAIEPTLLIIQAMTEFREGKSDAARTDRVHGNELLAKKFQANLDHGNNSEGYWFDWVFAKVLAREATEMITGEARSPSK